MPRRPPPTRDRRASPAWGSRRDCRQVRRILRRFQPNHPKPPRLARGFESLLAHFAGSFAFTTESRAPASPAIGGAFHWPGAGPKGAPWARAGDRGSGQDPVGHPSQTPLPVCRGSAGRSRACRGAVLPCTHFVRIPQLSLPPGRTRPDSRPLRTTFGRSSSVRASIRLPSAIRGALARSLCTHDELLVTRDELLGSAPKLLCTTPARLIRTPKSEHNPTMPRRSSRPPRLKYRAERWKSRHIRQPAQAANLQRVPNQRSGAQRPLREVGTPLPVPPSPFPFRPAHRSMADVRSRSSACGSLRCPCPLRSGMLSIRPARPVRV
jgi:hypothetical protein